MNPMSGKRIKVTFMDKAREFISSLPDKARKKITYNLLKLEGGEMDRELFNVTAFSPSGTRERKRW